MPLFLLFACSVPTEPAARTPAPAARVAKGAVHTVDCNGGAEFSDIRSAITAAESGDTITVAPCRYYGSLHLDGKLLDIEGADPATTIVYASPGTSVLKVSDGEPRGTTVAGLTLTGGGGDVEIPGIEVSFASLVLRNAIVTGNRGFVTIYGRSAHLIVQDSVIEGNTPTDGMVLQERRGETILKDSTISCGTAAIGIITEHGASLIDGGTFDCPGAIAVEEFHAPGRIQRSVLTGMLHVENEGAGTEGTVVKGSILKSGAEVYYSDLTLHNVVSTGPVSAYYANLEIESSVITGQTCAITTTGASLSTEYDVFWDNDSNNCSGADPVGRDGTSKQEDPEFVNATSGDFTLAAGSPLIDAGYSTSSYNDPDGSRNDIGAYGGRHSLGGGW